MDFYTLSELHKKWNKTEAEILSQVGQSKLLAACWFRGLTIVQSKPTTKDNYLFCGRVVGSYSDSLTEFMFDDKSLQNAPPSTFFRGWVWVFGKDVSLLRVQEEATTESLFPTQLRENKNRHHALKERQDSGEKLQQWEIDSLEEYDPEQDKELYPIFYKALKVKDENDGKWKWGAVPFKFTRKDLVFLDYEVKYFEKIYPDWLKSKTDSSPKKVDLNPKKGDSYLKIILGMALEGYDYDPTLNKSPTPNAIKEDLSFYGLDIDVGTIRNILKEASAKFKIKTKENS